MPVQMLKKRLANLYAIFPICALVLFAIFYADAKPNIHTPSFSGEELFKGIFFARGDVAQILPETAEKNNFQSYLSKQQEQKMLINQKLIIQEIKNSNPDFFSNFKGSIESNNYQEILRTLIQSVQLMDSVISNVKIVEKTNSDKYGGIVVEDIKIIHSSQAHYVTNKAPESSYLFHEQLTKSIIEHL